MQCWGTDKDGGNHVDRSASGGEGLINQAGIWPVHCDRYLRNDLGDLHGGQSVKVQLGPE